MKAGAEREIKQMAETETMTGADLLIQTLEAADVETVFGYPGGAVLPIYDALYRSDASFKHILTRHEQGAVHAAEGYARVTGKPGVVLSTSGPGATNLMTGITDAMMDSLPLVIFTGQVATSAIGSDAFQESDVMGITTPVTKYNYQVRDLADLPRIVKEAFHIASSGRPGPVVVDIPKDIASTLSSDQLYPGAADCHLPGYQPNQQPNPLQTLKLAEALGRSEKPLILAGAGIVFAEASGALQMLAEKQQIPVVNTLHGLGSFPGSHELFFGMAGMHGSYAANRAIVDCDLLLNVGARFDDRLTGNLQYFAPNAKVAHIDIDPAEIGKNVDTDIPVVADAGKALDALLNTDISNEQQPAWLETLKANRQKYPYWYDRHEEFISPQWLIEQIYKESNGQAIVTTDVGQHQMWAAQYYLFDHPNRWVTSGGLGTMGFGFPAAVGAQIGAPDDLVVAVVGDGGFQMTAQELSVLSEKQLPVKVVIINNQSLGMVRQWQESFYEQRYSESIFPENPDFVKLAECYGVRGMRADQEEEAAAVLSEAFAYDGPVVIDCRVVQEECVYPMIAPGKGIHDMIGVTR